MNTEQENNLNNAPEECPATPQTSPECPSPPDQTAPAGDGDEMEALRTAAREAALQAEAAQASFEKASATAAEARDALLRTAAEYDNYRKRTTKEKDAAFGNGTAWAVTALLPAVDALELAAGAQCADPDYKKGVEMTLSQWQAAMEKLGVSEIPALGLPFDPNCHAAVMRGGEGEAGTVTAVLQKGYKMGERVLRHASVAVAGE